jgi:hypothetical protein
MKKHIIALGVAAAMGGFAGTASAQSANTLEFNPLGVGHILIVPYFSTQDGNVSALNIVNTDTVNGKAIKVRFRGASNSDDIYDFQVFLSPSDVWTAGISRGSDGRSMLATTDKSCTLPFNVNGSFIVDRVATAAQAGDRNAETREGYIEVLNMGDIYDGGAGTNSRALYNATKHVSGVAPCTTSVLSAITRENSATYLRNPTTGLMANWTIINTTRVVAYSGEAAAIEARNASTGVTGTGAIVYWDQRSTGISPADAAANTADPLLVGSSPWVSPARYDLPDLSTPYTAGTSTPTVQAWELSNAIAARQIVGEFYNLASVGAATDWVVSFPTRRYFAAVRYTGSGAPAPVYNSSSLNIYFNSGNTEMGSVSGAGRAFQLCQRFGLNAVAFWDREETPRITDNIVISPGTPTSLSLCGEVSVVGLNGAGAAASATFGALTRTDVSNGFVEGWGSVTVPSADGLPVLARQFTRVNNTQSNVYYGLSYSARVTAKGALAP